MQNVNIEIWMLIVAVLGVAWQLFDKLDKIWKAISQIRESFVKDEECQHHRENCPCVKDMETIKQDILNKTSWGKK